MRVIKSAISPGMPKNDSDRPTVEFRKIGPYVKYCSGVTLVFFSFCDQKFAQLSRRNRWTDFALFKFTGRESQVIAFFWRDKTGKKFAFSQFLSQKHPKRGVNRHFQAKLANIETRISSKLMPIPTKFCTTIKIAKYCSWWAKDMHNKSKMADGQPFWEIQKSPYLGNGFITCHEIWHD